MNEQTKQRIVYAARKAENCLRLAMDCEADAASDAFNRRPYTRIAAEARQDAADYSVEAFRLAKQEG